MKILFESAEPFLAELTREATDGHVWRNQVRFDSVASPEQQEGISFKIGLVLTALIDVGDDGQYIIEAVIHCGSDDPDVDPKDAGTQNMLAIMKQVHAAANEVAVSVLPGRLQG